MPNPILNIHCLHYGISDTQHTHLNLAVMTIIEIILPIRSFWIPFTIKQWYAFNLALNWTVYVPDYQTFRIMKLQLCRPKFFELFPHIMHTSPIFSFHHRKTLWTRIAQSVQRLATGWTVQGSNTGGREDFLHLSRLALGPHNLLYNGYRAFPGGKVPGTWHRLPTPI